MFEIITSYKGYDLTHEEFDDSDGFIKNVYMVTKDSKWIKEVRKEDGQSYTYGRTDDLVVNFKRTVDLIIG